MNKTIFISEASYNMSGAVLKAEDSKIEMLKRFQILSTNCMIHCVLQIPKKMFVDFYGEKEKYPFFSFLGNNNLDDCYFETYTIDIVPKKITEKITNGDKVLLEHYDIYLNKPMLLTSTTAHTLQDYSVNQDISKMVMLYKEDEGGLYFMLPVGMQGVLNVETYYQGKEGVKDIEIIYPYEYSGSFRKVNNDTIFKHLMLSDITPLQKKEAKVLNPKNANSHLYDIKQGVDNYFSIEGSQFYQADITLYSAFSILHGGIEMNYSGYEPFEIKNNTFLNLKSGDIKETQTFIKYVKNTNNDGGRIFLRIKGGYRERLFITLNSDSVIRQITEQEYTETLGDEKNLIRKTKGLFAEKPALDEVPENFCYFCTDRKAPGVSESTGLFIRKIGKDWLDALGRKIV